MRQLLIVLLLLYSAASPADESARLKEANFLPQWRDGKLVLMGGGKIGRAHV